MFAIMFWDSNCVSPMKDCFSMQRGRTMWLGDHCARTHLFALGKGSSALACSVGKMGYAGTEEGCVQPRALPLGTRGCRFLPDPSPAMASSRLLGPPSLWLVKVHSQWALSQLVAGQAGARSFHMDMPRCNGDGVWGSCLCPRGPVRCRRGVPAGLERRWRAAWARAPPRWERCAVAYAPVLCFARRCIFKKLLLSC